MKRVIALLICIICLVSFSSCGMAYTNQDNEEEKFNETITALFSALDNRDGDAIYALFSPAVRKQQGDLGNEIYKLMLTYEGPTDAIGWDGLLGVNTRLEESGRSRTAFSIFPLRSGDTYYWCYMELVCVNTIDEQQIGIKQLDFYTADEYCLSFYEDIKREDTVGLKVHADQTIDDDIRCISGKPHKYSSSTEVLNIDEVKAFFKNTNSFSEFKEQFGTPNAEKIFYYYELPLANGKPQYLELGVIEDEDRIYAAIISNDFEYIETIYREED